AQASRSIARVSPGARFTGTEAAIGGDAFAPAAIPMPRPRPSGLDCRSEPANADQGIEPSKAALRMVAHAPATPPCARTPPSPPAAPLRPEGSEHAAARGRHAAG